jgi:DNA-binding response OmpR family regulator
VKQLLLAEDDIDLGNILKQFLEMSGYKVVWKQNGEESYDYLKLNSVAACIIDVMMPRIDGFTLAEKIIDLYPGTPFIFLTARNQKEDRLRGLGLGADDYIVKPFEVDELVLRLNNIIKRSEDSLSKNEEYITIGSYKLDCGKHLLHRGNGSIRITELETKILSYLSANKNKIVKRKDILLTIWKADDYFTGRSFDVFLSRIRKHLQEDKSVSIISVRNVGIEFRVDSISV